MLAGIIMTSLLRHDYPVGTFAAPTQYMMPGCQGYYYPPTDQYRYYGNYNILIWPRAHYQQIS